MGAPCYKYKKIKQLQNKQALRSQVLYPTELQAHVQQMFSKIRKPSIIHDALYPGQNFLFWRSTARNDVSRKPRLSQLSYRRELDIRGLHRNRLICLSQFVGILWESESYQHSKNALQISSNIQISNKIVQVFQRM